MNNESTQLSDAGETQAESEVITATETTQTEVPSNLEETVIEVVPVVPVVSEELNLQKDEAPTIEVAVPVTEEVSADTVVPVTPTAETTEEKASTEVETQKHKSGRQERFDKLYAEIEKAKEENTTIEVEIKSRIRGGLNVQYKDLQLFLPASHFSLKRSPSEQEMKEAVGTKINVYIHEMQEYDEGRKAVIVSRKKMLLDDFWGKISVGDIVEGKISSVATFGVFVDIGGVEGLIHISRLSKVHIDDPKNHYKKGDIIQSVIIEIDKEKNKIALSRKELEASPWKGIEAEFPVGTQCTGKVKRLTDFGAYVELKPGIDGLLRVSELSWTKRVKSPSDVLTTGQDVLVEVLSISEEKQSASLSYKKTQPNPWSSLIERFPVGSEIEGNVIQVMPQGVIISIAEDVDGFMPRSKMRKILKGKKIPYSTGEKATVIISDIRPEEESLILGPKEEEESAMQSERTERPDRRKSNDGERDNQKHKPAQNSSFSLGDLLSEKERQKLDSISK